MQGTYENSMNEVRLDYVRQVFEARERAEWKGFSRMDELRLLQAVASGNRAQVEQYLAESARRENPPDVGHLSDNPLHQARYLLVALTTLVTRACIDSGLPERLALSISDAYIRNADTCNRIDEIEASIDEMLFDFCRNMHDWRLEGCSLPVRVCCEYVLEHLHEKITLEQLSVACSRSPHHVSDMFCKDLGMRPMEFIRKEKLRQARFSLDNLNLTIANISELFAFASPSAFSKQFHEEFGITPLEYRKTKSF